MGNNRKEGDIYSLIDFPYSNGRKQTFIFVFISSLKILIMKIMTIVIPILFPDLILLEILQMEEL